MCFSLEAIKELLIWIVVVCAIVALIRLLLANVIPAFPFSNVVVGALNIILWAIVAVACIVLVFDLIACLLPLPRLR